MDLSIIGRLDKRQLILAGVGIVILVATMLLVISYTGRADFVVFQKDLDLASTGAITKELEALGIEYQMQDQGTSIAIPVDKLDRARMELAMKQLPTGGARGYELFDKQSGLGMTGFVQQINYTRALEGEISRSIATISAVRKARIHLVIQSQQRLFQKSSPSKASVVLQLNGMITPQQVKAITYLVSEAVPRMTPSNVSIIDTLGNVLSINDQIGNMFDVQRKYELQMEGKVMHLLESTLGPGNVRISVRVDMNQDRINERQELVEPDANAIKSRVTIEETQTDTDQEKDKSLTKVQENQDYEISKRIINIVRSPMSVKRVSVAVLLNGRYKMPPKKDKIDTEDTEKKQQIAPIYHPLTKEDINNYRELVINALALDTKRGDTVDVQNIQFYRLADTFEEQASEEVDSLLHMLHMDGDQWIAVLRIVIIGISIVLVLIFLIRPFIQSLLSSDSKSPVKSVPNESGTAQEGTAQAAMNMPNVQPVKRANPSDEIADIADQNKDVTVAIMRQWLRDKA